MGGVTTLTSTDAPKDNAVAAGAVGEEGGKDAGRETPTPTLLHLIPDVLELLTAAAGASKGESGESAVTGTWLSGREFEHALTHFPLPPRLRDDYAGGSDSE